MKVVLVHGFSRGAKVLSRLSRHLTEAGHSCFCPDLRPFDARFGIAPLAEQLAQFVDATLGPDERFALVGLSMGALISRHYLQELGGHRRITHFFSIAGPNAGTVMAYLYPGRGTRDMRPGSEFLRRLTETSDRLAQIPTTCYWSPLDTHIIPAESACLPHADNVRLFLAFHPGISGDPRVRRDIARRLGAAGE